MRYALLPARLQFDRAMAGVRAQLEAQSARQASYFLVGRLGLGLGLGLGFGFGLGASPSTSP